MSKSIKKEIQSENTVQKNKVKYRRSNYWKYEEVKDSLRACLNDDMTVAEIVKIVEISQMTFHKYKAMLSHEEKKQYMTRDERAYLEDKKKKKDNNKQK